MKRCVVLALIVLAGVIPFSSRAVFMDEHIFLRIAESAQHDWRFPQDTPGVFFGRPMANFAGHTHPPVGEYYLAFIDMALGGFAEIPFRLLFSVFSITAVLAFYFLAQRFTDHPFLAGMLFALSPAFFVMMPTIMMDIPMLAFLLLGVAFYFAHLEGMKHRLGIAALCFVISAGIGYTALVPLACLFIFILLARRPWKELMAVAAAPLALVVWQLAMTVHFHAIPITQTVAYYKSQHNIGHNMAATLSFLGGVALFPWTVLLLDEEHRKTDIAIASIAAVVFAAIVGAPSLSVRVWYGILAGSGTLLIAVFLRSSRRILAAGRNSGEGLFLLWAPVTLVFFILVADMINARYMLLSLPAVYLVVFRHTTARKLQFALVPTAILSVCIAYADFTYVNSYRNWVHQTVTPLQEQGFKVWNASESGLRFYLERQGIATLTSTDIRPNGTDLIVSQDLFRYGLSTDLATMLTVLKRFTLDSSFPLRTFNRAAGAGFHDSRIGITPFSFSLAPLDQVEVAQVSPFVTRLPQSGIPAEDVPAWSPNGVILKQHADTRQFRLKIPANCKLEYEVVGRGTAETTPDGIILKRISPETILWRKFRIMPIQFIEQGS